MALVFNIERVSGATLRAQRRHDQRIDNTPHADPDRRHLNRVLCGSGDPVSDTEAVVASHKAKARADNERPYHRFVLSASPDELDTPQKVAEFERKAMGWLRKTYGPGLAYAVAHLDEKTYHIHAVAVPLYQQTLNRGGKSRTRWKISHKQHPATRGRDSYARLRRDCADELGLEYGTPGGKPKSQEMARTLDHCRTIEEHARSEATRTRRDAEQAVALNLRMSYEMREEAERERQKAATERKRLEQELGTAERIRRALVQERRQWQDLGAVLTAMAQRQGRAQEAQAIREAVAKVEPAEPQAMAQAEPSGKKHARRREGPVID